MNSFQCDFSPVQAENRTPADWIPCKNVTQFSHCVHSFLKMAEILGVAPEKILYVGNSKKYDVIGSKRAGMKSAYLLSGFKRIFKLKDKDADISFCNYRQLQDIVLN